MCLIIIIKMSLLSIKMNETLSLLLATTILALGGAGLYMYKSDEQESSEDNDYNEENIFINDEDEINDEGEEYIDEYYKSTPRARSRKPKTKTKTTRKGGGTKRRH